MIGGFGRRWGECRMTSFELAGDRSLVVANAIDPPSYVNIPVIAFCSTDAPLKFVDSSREGLTRAITIGGLGRRLGGCRNCGRWAVVWGSDEGVNTSWDPSPMSRACRIHRSELGGSPAPREQMSACVLGGRDGWWYLQVEEDGWGIIKPLDNKTGAWRPSDGSWTCQRFLGPVYRVKSVPHRQIRVGGFTSIWGTISTSSEQRGRLVAGAVGSEEGWGGQELIGVCRRTRTREHPLVRIMGGEDSCRECVACIPSLCGCGTTSVPAPAEQESARVVGGENGWWERRRIQEGCWGTVKPLYFILDGETGVARETRCGGRPRRPMTSCYFEGLRKTRQGDATDGLGWKHSFLIPWTSESVRGGRWRLRGIKRRPLLIGRLRQGNLNTKMSSRRLTSVVNYTDIELNPEGEECRRRTGGGGKVVEEEEEEKKKAESLENSVGCAGLLYTFIVRKREDSLIAKRGWTTNAQPARNSIFQAQNSRARSKRNSLTGPLMGVARYQLGIMLNDSKFEWRGEYIIDGIDCAAFVTWGVQPNYFIGIFEHAVHIQSWLIIVRVHHCTQECCE
ncbi:hypothetical protein CPB84DRAFT_1752171 [Gymnopilus junonius]|uniref:Uncharacterized protein n=1 Tax=Gymnopilus junonius TaxID=109634 RepID=A0A9P5NBR1_GYMJU|nr:hypothetical protein CPB84DRAFT_1752171 [Gymnopilus junonius]